MGVSGTVLFSVYDGAVVTATADGSDNASQ